MDVQGGSGGGMMDLSAEAAVDDDEGSGSDSGGGSSHQGRGIGRQRPGSVYLGFDAEPVRTDTEA